MLSITLNPLLFNGVEPIARWLTAHPRWLEALERAPAGVAPAVEPEAPLAGHAVIVGYGRVGGTIGEALTLAGIPQTVIEQDRLTVESLRRRGIPAIFGDAARPGILSHASLAKARLLVIAAPNPFEVRQIIELARALNGKIDILARTHSEAEKAHLEKMGVGRAFMGERELALAMADYALRALGRREEDADRIVEGLRQQTPAPGEA